MTGSLATIGAVYAVEQGERFLGVPRPDRRAVADLVAVLAQQRVHLVSGVQVVGGHQNAGHRASFLIASRFEDGVRC